MNKLILLCAFFCGFVFNVEAAKPKSKSFLPQATCKTVATRQRDGVKWKTKNESLCFTNEKSPYFLSSSCHKTGKCEALKLRRVPASLQNSFGYYGNPMYHVCDVLGGSAEKIEIQNGSTWRETSLCRFKDKSFVNLAFWYGHVLRFEGSRP